MSNTVQVLYNYESRTARGHSVVVQPGERFVLLSDTNEEWWYVAKDAAEALEDGFYLPASYVQRLSESETGTSTFRSSHGSTSGSIRKSKLFSEDGYRLLTAPVTSASHKPSEDKRGSSLLAKSSFKSGQSGPGFWLAANPNRVSRSIPGDLNVTAVDIELEENSLQRTAADRTEKETSRSSMLPVKTSTLPAALPVAAPRRSLERDSSDSEPSSTSSASHNNSNENRLSNGTTLTPTNQQSCSSSSEEHENDTDEVLSDDNDSQAELDGDERHYENLHEMSSGYPANSDGGTVMSHSNSTVSRTPPVPSSNEQPIRHLEHDWAEYLEPNSGRTYFHHHVTGYSSWKPPRNLVGPKEIEAFLRQSQPISSDRNEPDLSGTKRLSYGALKEALRTNESTDSAVTTSSPSADESKSSPSPSPGLVRPSKDVSELSASAIASAHASSTNNSATMSTSVDSGLGRSSLANSRTNNNSKGRQQRSFMRPKHSHMSNGEDSDIDILACSEDMAVMAASSEQNMNAVQQMMHARVSSQHYYGKHPMQQKTAKSGTLDRCKTVEAGKKIKKQWATCFVFLNQMHLIFYKDEKSSVKRENHYPTPLGVSDLRGAQLRWAEPEKKHKHVFLLETIDCSEYLFSCADTLEINSWYQAIRITISKLPQPDVYPLPATGTTVADLTEPNQRMQASRRSVVVRTSSEQKHNNAQHKLHSNSVAVASSSQQSFNEPNSPESSQQRRESRDTILERLRRFFRTRPSLETLKEKGIYKPEPVFGSSLMEICKREKCTVPRFIRVCTALIEQKGLDVDGLYRISGNLSQIQKIRCQVDQDKYSQLEAEGDIHVVSGALKLFFRELQEPVIPFCQSKDFLDAMRINKPKQRVQKFKELLAKMPPPHHDTLQFLFDHLLRVAAEWKSNRMQAHNLAIVFGPTLFTSSPAAGGASSSSKKQSDTKHPKKKSVMSHGAAASSKTVDVVQSNSHVAFNMIMQGQIVEYMLKENSKFFVSTCAVNVSTNNSVRKSTDSDDVNRIALLPPVRS